MRDIPADTPDDIAVKGLEENLWDMWAAFGRGDGCVLVDSPTTLRFETPIPFIPYNSIMRSHFAHDCDDEIDNTLRPYVARDVPLMWVVHPSATPRDLDARLEARGLVEAEVCPGMVGLLDDVPDPGPAPPGVAIEQLRSGLRGEFVELVAWRYSLPADAVPVLLSVMAARRFGEPDCPTMGWVARVDGKVVSKATLHLAAGVAGLYGVATRTEARALGLARILTATAFARARELGYGVGVLHSTPMALNLYLSLGFRPVADFRLFSAPDTLHL